MQIAMTRDQTHINQLVQRTRSDAAALQRAADTRRDFSLMSLIQSRCPDMPITDKRGLEAAHELDRQAMQTHGSSHAEGSWVPFAALCRDLTTANTSTAISNLMHPVLGPGSIPARSVIGAGATIMTGLSGGATLALPVATTQPDIATAGVWNADGDPSPQREPVFGQRVMHQKTISIEMLITRRLLLQSSIDVERELRAMLARQIFNAIDAAIIGGDGLKQPLGLLNDAGLNVLAAGANGLAPTWQHVVNLEHEVGLRVGGMSAAGWLMHPNLRKKLRTTARGTGLDYIMPSIDLLRYPVSVSTSIPAALTKGTGTGLTALVFGDLAELYVGFWGPAAVDVLVDGVTLRKDGKVKIIGRVDVGFVARNIEAFAAYKDLNPA